MLSPAITHLCCRAGLGPLAVYPGHCGLSSAIKTSSKQLVEVGPATKCPECPWQSSFRWAAAGSQCAMGVVSYFYKVSAVSVPACENTLRTPQPVFPIQLNAETVFLCCSDYPQGSTQKGGGRVRCGKAVGACGSNKPRAVLSSPPPVPSLLPEWTGLSMQF